MPYIIRVDNFADFCAKLDGDARKKVIVKFEGYHHITKKLDVLSCAFYAVPTSFYDNTSIHFHRYIELTEKSYQETLSLIRDKIEPKAVHCEIRNHIYPLRQTRFL